MVRDVNVCILWDPLRIRARSTSEPWRAWNHRVVCAQSHHPTWLCQQHEGQHWVTVPSLLPDHELETASRMPFITLHHWPLSNAHSRLIFFWQCFSFCFRLTIITAQCPWSDCVLFTAHHRLTILHYITSSLLVNSSRWRGASREKRRGLIDS